MTRLPWSAAHLSLVLALAACGGGGGGGGTPVVQAPAPQPVVVPAAFQSPGTTVTYSVDSASATAASNSITGSQISQSGGANTVTVSTTPSGNLSQVAFNIQTPGTAFTNTYTQFVSVSSLTLGELATKLAYINTNASTAGSLFLPSSLSYSAFGIWGSNDTGTSGRLGAIALGTQTVAGAMPASGTATYNGTAVGILTSTSNNPGAYAMLGNIQLGVNFGTNAISTTISNVQLQNLATNATSTDLNLTGTGTISGNRYTSTLAGPNAGTSPTGSLVGTFYGSAAQETAGAWKVSNATVSAVGSFGAKK